MHFSATVVSEMAENCHAWNQVTAFSMFFIIRESYHLDFETVAIR